MLYAFRTGGLDLLHSVSNSYHLGTRLCNLELCRILRCGCREGSWVHIKKTHFTGINELSIILRILPPRLGREGGRVPIMLTPCSHHTLPAKDHAFTVWFCYINFQFGLKYIFLILFHSHTLLFRGREMVTHELKSPIFNMDNTHSFNLSQSTPQFFGYNCLSHNKYTFWAGNSLENCQLLYELAR